MAIRIKASFSIGFWPFKKYKVRQLRVVPYRISKRTLIDDNTYKVLQSNMSQLSPFSQSVVQKLHTLLALIQGFISLFRKIVFRKIPKFGANVSYLLSALKDIASFLPSYLYKAALALFFFVLVYRKIKRHLHFLQKSGKLMKINQQNCNQKSQLFANSAQEFKVKQNICKALDCSTPLREQDSRCRDLTSQLQQQSQDFRDVIFFQLMRGYRRSLSQQSNILPRNINKSE